MNKKAFAYKEKLDTIERSELSIEQKKDKRNTKKLRQLKKKRLIIRNLSFKASEEDLKKLFSHYGEVLDVKIPINEAGKKRGFAFVQFKDTKAQIKAIKELNFKKIYGRPIAVDFAVDKTTYQSHKNSSYSKNNVSKETEINIKAEDTGDEQSESESKLEKVCDNNSGSQCIKDTKLKEFLREFDADDEMHEDAENETSDESSEDDEQESCHSAKSGSDDDDDDDDDDNDKSSVKNKTKKKHLDDVSEGKTVFIRNLSYNSAEEDLQEIAQEYGKTVYCLFCNDSITGHFKGTAFVKFKEKESADKLIEESLKEPGILLDGRKLSCIQALSQKELSEKQDVPEKDKDKRNLRFLKCGLIPYGSKESEGVSQTDMAKRAQLEAAKKQKLKNVNFFIADKRLVCHNLPKNINNKDLHNMFKKAAGKDAVITEARVMRDMKKTDALGVPISRGFGFIAFKEHEHALKAMIELNNNPKIFTSDKRPIVEFSVENKMALLSQQRRHEKIKMRNKKRLEEQKIKVTKEYDEPQAPKISVIKEKRQNTQNKKKPTNSNSYSSAEKVSPNKKKKHGKHRNRRTQKIQKREEISALTQKYKEKLLNKLS